MATNCGGMPPIVIMKLPTYLHGENNTIGLGKEPYVTGDYLTLTV